MTKGLCLVYNCKDVKSRQEEIDGNIKIIKFT